MDSKSSRLHFFTSLPIQSAYGSNSQDLFQKFEPDNTTQYLFKFCEAPSCFSLGQSPSLKVGLGICRTNADSQWNPVYNAFR